MTKTKAKPLTPEKAYQLIIECYQSGLSTKQWLLENGIHQATFYKWVKKLRETAGYNFPPDNRERKFPVIAVKQDVVRVDVIPDNSLEVTTAGNEITPSQISVAPKTNRTIVIQFKEAKILISDNTDQELLTSVIRSLKAALC